MADLPETDDGGGDAEDNVQEAQDDQQRVDQHCGLAVAHRQLLSIVLNQSLLIAGAYSGGGQFTKKNPSSQKFLGDASLPKSRKKDKLKQV